MLVLTAAAGQLANVRGQPQAVAREPDEIGAKALSESIAGVNMGCIIVTNFYCYPDGREVLQKDLYFPEERDIMELRKKTNWVKGAKGQFIGSVPTGGGSVKMSKSERRRVSSAIATNFPSLKPGAKRYNFCHGNYAYKFSVVEFGNYTFHGKRKLK